MKKILIIIFLIMIIISTYQINSMYALYKTEVSGDYEQQLGIWYIKVNESTEQSITLDDKYFKFATASSEHTADGVIAPGRQMYFEIVLDPSYQNTKGERKYTDVSISYEMNLKNKVTTEYGEVNLKMIKVEESYIKDGNVTLDTTNSKYSYLQDYENNHSLLNNKYKCVFPLKTINEGWKKRLLVYFTWDNADTKLRNENDTQLGQTEDLKISIPITMKFEQYT